MRHRVKFYTDEHIGKAVARSLRRRGADVLMARDVGMTHASDEEHLQLAHSQGRVLITQDEDSLALAAGGIDHRGIAYAHQEPPWRRIMESLTLIYEVLDAGDMAGQVEYL